MKEPPSDYNAPQPKETNLNSKSVYSQYFIDKAIIFIIILFSKIGTVNFF